MAGDAKIIGKNVELFKLPTNAIERALQPSTLKKKFMEQSKVIGSQLVTKIKEEAKNALSPKSVSNLAGKNPTPTTLARPGPGFLQEYPM